MLDKNRIPAHVAIIMDGNGRWAKKRLLPVAAGHNAGMKAMKEIVKRASSLGVKHLTVYAFSTENWKRSSEEVGGIFKLLVKYVGSELAEIDENNVRIRIIGDYSVIPEDAYESVLKALSVTEGNTGLQFNIALNYGGREEIRRAFVSLCEDGVSPSEITENMISERLYTGMYGIPDPDLLIRPGGEKRVSNFLLWQLAYSEFVFTDTLWPDFTPEKFEEAIEVFQSRNRRYGGRTK